MGWGARWAGWVRSETACARYRRQMQHAERAHECPRGQARSLCASLTAAARCATLRVTLRGSEGVGRVQRQWCVRRHDTKWVKEMRRCPGTPQPLALGHALNTASTASRISTSFLPVSDLMAFSALTNKGSITTSVAATQPSRWEPGAKRAPKTGATQRRCKSSARARRTARAERGARLLCLLKR